MTTAHRQRILGDVGENAPGAVGLGRAGDRPASTSVLLLYARDAAGLAAARGRAARAGSRRAASRCSARSSTSDLDGFEPFGFRDGISQPFVEGLSKTGPRRARPFAPGEFVLGYPNEYGLYTDEPLLDRDPASCRATEGSARRPRPQRHLPRLPPAASRTCRGFWRFVDEATRRPDGSATRGAAPARREDGRALAERRAARARARRATTRRSPSANDFGYFHELDPRGAALPGRRARPAHEPARLARPAPGHRATRWRSTAATGSCGAAASTGTSLTIEEALAERWRRTSERGLHFICLNANIAAPVRVRPAHLAEQPEVRRALRRRRPARRRRRRRTAERSRCPTDGVRERVTRHAALRHGQGRRLLLPAGPRSAALPARASAASRGTSSSPVGS